MQFSFKSINELNKYFSELFRCSVFFDRSLLIDNVFYLTSSIYESDYNKDITSLKDNNILYLFGIDVIREGNEYKILNINTIMNKKIKELLERLHEEGHINNSEYNMLMSLNSKVVVTRYSLDNVNTTWEPFTKIVIPESKL